MNKPLNAMFSSWILPGLGQINNGQKAKGAIFIALAVIIIVGLLVHFAAVMMDYFKAVGDIAEPVEGRLRRPPGGVGGGRPGCLFRG